MDHTVVSQSAERKTVLLVEPRGRVAFSYTRVDADSGETVWRWPNTPARDATSNRSSLVDVRA